MNFRAHELERKEKKISILCVPQVKRKGKKVTSL